MNLNKGFSIAIDGPVASGKGTIARLLSEKLNGVCLYTGAMYRCVALYCIENKIDINVEKAVVASLSHVKIDLMGEKVFLDRRDVTERIKDQDVTQGSSVVGVYKEVREDLVRRQQEITKREMAKGKVVIVEGRDIATVVLPNAELKIFITASPLVRAKRRREQENLTENVEEVLDEIKRRDERDSQRTADPLVKNPEKFGYFVINNSDQNSLETLNTILEELKRRNLIND